MKNYIFKFVAIFIIAFLSANLVYGQSDSEKKLKEDLVKIIDNKYVINDYTLIKIKEHQFQIKMTANAPLNVISRDNFISIYSTLAITMMLSMFEEVGYRISDLDITDLDELIGQADFIFNFIMTKNGMQIQIKTEEGTQRLTMTWDEVLGN